MGYFAGKEVKDSSVSLSNISELDIIKSKALCAAVGTSGSCGTFTFGTAAKEKISFGKKDAQSVTDELSNADDEA